jgi:hypothetical protein
MSVQTKRKKRKACASHGGTHILSPAIQEVIAGESQVPSQLEQHSEILTSKTKRK